MYILLLGDHPTEYQFETFNDAMQVVYLLEDNGIFSATVFKDYVSRETLVYM